MTQIADVLVLEPVAHVLREAARLLLELRPEILPPEAALLYEAIDDSLIPYLKGKEAHRLPYRPGYRHGPLRRACRSALLEPDPPAAAWGFPHPSRARVL